MKVLFLTFQEGHLVSDKEFSAMQRGLAKVGVELIHWYATKGPVTDYDLVMVKGWSHTWEQVKAINTENRPVVYLSIGTEWKVGADRELNEPIRDLYFKSQAVIHLSEYCKRSHKAIFGPYKIFNESVIIAPAREPNLPSQYIPIGPLRLATTCIPRPVKRSDELEQLCREEKIELVPAWGGISDFSYYHTCHGYIHLSRKEGMPNTVLEAMAMGLPCIVTNYGGAAEAIGDAGVIIKNDPDGVAWDPSNIGPIDRHLFVEAIEKFRENLPELRRKNRERVLSQVNDYVSACQLKEVFESLV